MIFMSLPLYFLGLFNRQIPIWRTVSYIILLTLNTWHTLLMGVLFLSLHFYRLYWFLYHSQNTKCFCIFQNASSDFARFSCYFPVEHGKITQDTTSGMRWSERRYSYQSTEHILRNFSIILSVCKCNIIYFYRLYIYEIAIPTTHPPQAVPLPSQGKAIKNKKCPAFAGHRIY